METPHGWGICVAESDEFLEASCVDGSFGDEEGTKMWSNFPKSAGRSVESFYLGLCLGSSITQWSRLHIFPVTSIRGRKTGVYDLPGPRNKGARMLSPERPA